MIREAKVRPKYYTLIKFSVDLRKTNIGYRIISDIPITLYILEEKNVSDYYKGGVTDYFLKHEGSNYYEREIRLPYNGYWYLLFENPGSKEAYVYYDVYPL